MIKRRVENQIENLTPNYKTLESKGQMSSNWGVLYTVGKILLKAIRYCLCNFKINLIWERYEHPNFGTTILESWGKVTFRCHPHREAQSIL
jgi:hypothetical protein